MRTVGSIIEDVYGDAKTASGRLNVVISAISNWKAAGRFPARLAAVICQHARERGVDLDIAEIPLTNTLGEPRAVPTVVEAATQ